MPKRPKKGQPLSDDEAAEDIMAWGRRKDNYYQQGEDQYSQSGQQQLEAQELYERQLQQVGDQDNYQLPSKQQSSEQENMEQDEEKLGDSHLSHSYLSKQIARVAQLGLKINQEVDSKIRRVLETQIQAYLMALIGLRDLKIPYVEYHPLFSQTLQMKQDISKLKRLLQTSTLHSQSNGLQQDEVFGQQQEQQQQEELEDEQSENQIYEKPIKHLQKGRKRETDAKIEQGLRLYEEAKASQSKLKTLNKQLKRKQRQANHKPAFLEVKGNEGRLANEKILKNKGLLKNRKKEDRNSRVKHRRKFQKAQSKRRAYGHVIRQNPGRQYEGQRNIRYGRIASTKLK